MGFTALEVHSRLWAFPRLLLWHLSLNEGLWERWPSTGWQRLTKDEGLTEQGPMASKMPLSLGKVHTHGQHMSPGALEAPSGNPNLV